MKTLKVEKTGCWGMIDGVFQQLPVGHEFVAADVPAAFAGRVGGGRSGRASAGSGYARSRQSTEQAEQAEQQEESASKSKKAK
jgi:hypothetical protein